METFYTYISKQEHHVHDNTTLNKNLIFDTKLTEDTTNRQHNTKSYHVSTAHKNRKLITQENLKMTCSSRNMLY